ncbi:MULTISPECIES: hypothetical protein [unclassified Massilia]|uniref:hypothetical protein n=1 Tax=unclassified Massilia TaxID=2609279 RepID=UPI00178363FC|nr:MULTISPECIES: hypothetical protein [unclassified Massilia]MBD8529840.1 hypothetical protein [Massilia sp. CFBP 13647]MBD8672148.1 hypothetical protein [Massilia sp. CFBP 13721]
MNMLLLIAAACAALPGCAAGQAVPESRTVAAPPAPCVTPVDSARASSALPARASTRPEPQLGSIAAAGRVPSHALTPSARAMAAATARADNNAYVEKNTQGSCARAATSGAPAGGKARSDGT